MSVTLTIQNNTQYINANHPELIQVEVYEQGTAQEFTCKSYPFEFNVSNSNFAFLWQTLGLYTEDSYSGSIEPTLLQNCLKRLEIDSICRQDVVEDRYFMQGITLEKATRYYWSLMQLINEAKKRKALIVWY